MIAIAICIVIASTPLWVIAIALATIAEIFRKSNE